MADPAARGSERSLSFGPFRLLPTQRMLLEGEKPVRLGSRALDILIALTERAGEVVDKDELVARVWPNTFVDESNLKFQVSALRRTLGDGHRGNRYLATIPGRGYSFVAPLQHTQEHGPSLAQVAPAGHLHNLPVLLTRLIGRTDTVGRLVEQLPRQCMLTIVGPGGIGKTSVAFAVAEALIPAYAHGVWLVDLAPLTDARLVSSAVASVLGFEIRSDDPLPGLIPLLRDKRMLLLLDNCERVIDAAAAVATAVLKGARSVHILATSREPLRVEGERVHRLSPLPSPPASTRLTAAEAIGFPAVQLFVERAAAGLDDFALSDHDAPVVAEICRRLDGIPLAIELAAARVGVFGVRAVTAHLDDRFRLLTAGRRTSPPRHRTLRATLDWSYETLSVTERAVLRSLGLFAGTFTLDAVQAVASDGETGGADVVGIVADLVTRSFVMTEIGDASVRYRLPETIRAYAFEKLDKSGEREPMMRSYAAYHRDLLERANGEAAGRPTAEWLATYRYCIDDLRLALIWSFSGNGNASVGVALAARATDLWLAVSLLNECRHWGGKALAHLGAAEGTREEMILQCGFGQALLYSAGMTPDAQAALTRALRLAETLAEINYEFRAIFGLWLFAVRGGEFRESLALARKYERLAETVGDPAAGAIAHCLLGVSSYYLGEHGDAATNLERARAAYPIAMRSGDVIRFGVDVPVMTLCYQAMSFWLSGFGEKAITVSRDAINEARVANHPASLCFALAPKSVLLVETGDLKAADLCIDELIDRSDNYSLSSYYAFGLCAKGCLTANRGDLAAAEELLRAGLKRTRELNYYLFYPFFQSELAAVLAAAGDKDAGLAEVNAALRYAESCEFLWCVPEVLRVKGEILLLRGEADRTTAEDHFRRSLDLARRQRALSWELRTAISIARLQHDHGNFGEARDLLASVYDRFTEGFGTADLQTAKRLLDELT